MKKVFALALCCAASLSAQDPRTRAERWVELRLHTGDLMAPLADGLLDSAWRSVLAAGTVLKKLDLLPERPLRLELHTQAATYRDARSRGGPKYHVSSFPVAKDATAHVLLSPMPPEVLAITGLPMESREDIVRQLLWLSAAQTKIGSNDPWLCQVVAARALDDLDHPSLEAGKEPRFDARREIYRRLLQRGTAVTLGEWVDWMEPPRDSAQHASSWEMSGWCGQLLPARAGWAKKLLTPCRAAAKVSDPTAIRRAQLEATIGRKWDSLEKDLQQLMGRTQLGWIGFGPSAGLNGDHLLLASGEQAAQLVRNDGLPKGPFVLRAHVELVDVAKPNWRIEFQRGEKVSGVLLTPDRCSVADLTKHWEILARCNVSGMRFDAGELTIEVGEEVIARIDGAEAVRAPVHAKPPYDQICIVVGDGVLRLRNLTLEPLPQPR